MLVSSAFTITIRRVNPLQASAIVFRGRQSRSRLRRHQTAGNRRQATSAIVFLFLLAPLWSRWPGTVRVVKAK